MGASLSQPTVVLASMCFASAIFYVVATVLMKLGGGVHFALLLIPISTTFAAAAWFEVLVLRDGRIGQVFLLIFAFEVVMTALVAFFILRESYTPREITGLLTVVLGICVMLHGDANRSRGADAAPGLAASRPTFVDASVETNAGDADGHAAVSVADSR